MSDVTDSNASIQKPLAQRYVKLAVEAPISEPLTYSTDQNWPVGTSVKVPLARRTVDGVIVSETEPTLKYEVKSILSRLEDRPVLSPSYLNWLTWLSEYYLYPLGQVAGLCFPPLEKNSKRLSKKSPVVPQYSELDTPHKMTAEQAKAVADIQKLEGFQVHLLFGVTGSGKTEVYLRLLEETLSRGQAGLVLVPEISLTPQLIQRFAKRFGDQVAVLHSHLTDRERTNQWWSIVNGEKRILVGARSALFCPIDNLGLIVVDEEHEPSYKQEEKLRYHARDAAIVLARNLNIPILLGSATPSLETWHNTVTGKYHRHTMRLRVADRKLPKVDIIDLRTLKNSEETAPTTRPRWLTEPLFALMNAALERKEQVALFLNRRGMAPSVLCDACGFTYKCPNCEIPLTLHGQAHLVCHYCDFGTKKEDQCPSCKEGEIKSFGLGTEQVEQDLLKIYPDKKIARADRDEIHSRETLEDLITRMENHDIDILVGTQMIAKGLDFPKLTLVGLVLADIGFNMPDFRSTERNFQLVTQVSGRSGRHVVDGGQVVIQTYNPEYACLPYAVSADFENFAQAELNLREELHYPPFGRLAALKLTSRTSELGERMSELLADRAIALSQKYDRYKEIQILGPATAPMAKLRGKYRFHILLKSKGVQVLSTFCRHLLQDKSWLEAGTKVQVDIDPINLL